MRLPEEPERPLLINLVPMIDVIFAVLAFFILSSLYLTRSEGLPVNLPEALTSQPQTQQQITVSIQADGSVSVNRDAVTLENLVPEITALMEAEDARSSSGDTARSLVLVNADETVAHGRVVTVMDELRQIEGIQLA
ncbi:MAG: biopolymer transporter ExbD, partial [Kamptonema sp. SIO4C4]|nr:biopolymer transporter ExbD [Kamptonema sp. SIO4C4]